MIDTRHFDIVVNMVDLEKMIVEKAKNIPGMKVGDVITLSVTEPPKKKKKKKKKNKKKGK